MSSARNAFGSLLAARASSSANEHTANACGMFDTDRYQPTRTCASRRRRLHLHVGTSHGDVGRAQLHLEAGAGARVGPEQRHDRRERRSVQPCGDLARAVEPALHVLRGHGVVVAVTDLVVARPDHLDRRADVLRQQRRLDDEVGLRLAAEAAAEQRHVQRDLRQVDAERGGHFLARRLRVLRRRPDLARAVLHAGQRRRRLHRRVRQMRDVVVGARRAWPPIPSAAVTSPCARMAVPLPFDEASSAGAVGRRVVCGVGAVVPRDLQRAAALDRRIRVPRDDRDATERLEAGRDAATRTAE